MFHFFGLLQLIGGLIDEAEEILQHRMAEQEIAPKLKPRFRQRDGTVFLKPHKSVAAQVSSHL